MSTQLDLMIPTYRAVPPNGTEVIVRVLGAGMLTFDDVYNNGFTICEDVVSWFPKKFCKCLSNRWDDHSTDNCGCGIRWKKVIDIDVNPVECKQLSETTS